MATLAAPAKANALQEPEVTPRRPGDGVVRDGSVSRFRTRRFRLVREMIERICQTGGSCRILDLGGDFAYWRPFLPSLANMPIEIVLANLQPPDAQPDDSRFSAIVANACDLRDIPDASFDLVHSNSVIEHVGRWNEMSAMAREIRRVAASYYVQTPNVWFPIEPHYRKIGFQWLPDQFRAALHLRTKIGFYPRAADYSEAMRFAQDAVLLSVYQLQILFPGAEIVRERIGPLTKSLIARKLARTSRDANDLYRRPARA